MKTESEEAVLEHTSNHEQDVKHGEQSFQELEFKVSPPHLHVKISYIPS